MKHIFITYDNAKKQDGVGAQLQRILGLYSISRKFRLGYLHSPILNTAEELAHNVSNPLELQELLDRFNAIYAFPSTRSAKFDKEIYIHNLTIRLLVTILIKGVLTRQRILLRVCLPFGIMDKHPNWYKYAGSFLFSKRTPRDPNLEKKVVVHVRYGYKPIQGQNSGSAPRFLPLTYYSVTLKRILGKEKLPIDSHILVHTDIPGQSGQWKPFQKSKIDELTAIGYEIENQVLAYDAIDLKTEYFADFPNIEIKYCAPLLETLDDLISADVLLMSRSSFSYVAGVINPNSIYFPRSHGHAKLSRWKPDYPKRNSPKFELLSGI